MKTGTFGNVSTQKYLTFLFLVTAALLLFAATSFARNAQGNEGDGKIKEKLTPSAVFSLLQAIETGNEGLRKSAVYLVGIYEIEDAVPALVQMLKNETNEDIRVLAALSLYKIGSREALLALSNNADNELNPELQSICAEVRTNLSKEIKALNISNK